MARGDATYARCNVDWPYKKKCKRMPDNDARWLNHLMWLWATAERSPLLSPEKYDVEEMMDVADVSGEVVQESLRAMAELQVISMTEAGQIIVHGVVSENPKLKWKVEKCPEYSDENNPWMHDCKFLYGNEIPIRGLYPPTQAPLPIYREVRSQKSETEVRRVSNPKPRKSKKSRKKIDYTREFEAWWSIGPKTGGKFEASEEWRILNPDAKLRELLHYAVEEQMRWREVWLKVDKNHCPWWKHMCRWIKNGTWDLELDWPPTFGASTKSNLEGSVFHEQ